MADTGFLAHVLEEILVHKPPDVTDADLALHGMTELLFLRTKYEEPQAKRLLSSTCIQNTDLVVPIQKQFKFYSSYYQSLLLHVDRKISNTFRNMPVCPATYKAHLLSWQKHLRVRDPSTYVDFLSECLDVAKRMISTTLSKSPWEAGLVDTDIGSDDRLVQHNLQLSRFGLTSSHPGSILIYPYHERKRRMTPPTMPLLGHFLPPAYSMRSSPGMAPQRGPAQLPV
eukprot:1139313-Pelagomonas_calceolata.AAC.1